MCGGGNYVNMETENLSYDGNVTAAGNDSRGLHVLDDGNATVSGNVSAEGDRSTGIVAEKGGSITVGGSVTGEEAVGIQAFTGAEVVVAGSVTGGVDGILTQAGTNITVGGDVSGECGIAVSTRDAVEGDTGTIVTLGTVSGEEMAIFVDMQGFVEEDDDGNIIGVADDAADYLPDIVVSTLASSGELIGCLDPNREYPEISDEAMAQVMDTIVEKIYYIINAENVSVSGDVFQMAGYDTSREGCALTLAAADGYEVEESFGQYVTDWVRNDDGSYTLWVARGGDLVFRANVIPSPEPDPSPDHAGTDPVIENSEEVVFSARASHFLKVELDGMEIAPENYTVYTDSHGLLVFGFTEEFLATLAPGTYAGTLYFTDCTIHFSLVIE